MKTTPDIFGRELIDSLFAAPGDFTLTLEKTGDQIKVYGGNRRDFFNVTQAAAALGCSRPTFYRKYIHTKRLLKTRDGFRRRDIERLKKG